MFPNLETVPRLYKAVRPGSDFEWSLDLQEVFKKRVPHVPEIWVDARFGRNR